MVGAVIGKKISQSQKFLEDGTRIPVTSVFVPASPVVAVKTKDKHGYFALQIGFGTKKIKNRTNTGAEKKTAPLFLREISVTGDDISEDTMPKVGDIISVSDVLKPGDLIDVMGISKGKGYAGGVKRYHFKGGPRTHGQSDRERAPGSIGQTTTPGRVYKGKRMAGHMGVDTVTIQNLLVISVDGEQILIKGLVPGSVNTILTIKKSGEAKKFVPLYKVAVEIVAEEAPEQVVAEAEVSIEEEVQSEVVEEAKETKGTGDAEIEVEKAEEVEQKAEEPGEEISVDSSPSTVGDVKEGEAK